MIFVIKSGLEILWFYGIGDSIKSAKYSLELITTAVCLVTILDCNLTVIIARFLSLLTNCKLFGIIT